VRYFLVALLAIALIVTAFIAGCEEREDRIVIGNDKGPWDNPDDEGCLRDGIAQDPIINLPEAEFNNLYPAGGFTIDDDNSCLIRVNLAGIFNPTTDDPEDLTNCRSVYLEEDGEVRELRVTNITVEDDSPVDLVFTVDNSGSMGQEADAVAAGILAFAQQLETAGLDIRFGCVGYNGDPNGGINFTDAAGLDAYLNRPGASGTGRTVGWGGADSAALATADGAWGTLGWENGVVAVLFADSAFDWRDGIRRHYMNFTDEPTQPNGIFRWSTENMCDLLSGEATVHTVFSEDPSGSWTALQNEAPWEMSACTDGAVVFIQSDASDLDMERLAQVSIMITHRHILEFISPNSSAVHDVKILVRLYNGNTVVADGMTLFEDVTY